MIVKLLLRLIINSIALAAAAWAVSGIHYEGVPSLVAMALLFGLVNALIRPIVTVLSCPLMILTLGLFTFVVNALMLYLAGTIAALVGLNFRVEGFGAAFWGALVVSVVSFILSIVLRPDQDRSRSE